MHPSAELPSRAQPSFIGNVSGMADPAMIRQPDVRGDLLAAALEGLYVARDNKALIVAYNGEIVSLNQLASELCNCTSETLIGARVIGDLLKIDAPAGGSPDSKVRWETTLQTYSGQSIPVEVVREPLGSKNANTLVYAVRDLRDRKEAEAEMARKNRALEESELQLRIQNLRFNTAIDHMHQALAMFDAGNRLVVCNREYAELYGTNPSDIAPGTTVRQHLECGYAKRLFGDIDFETFAAEWLEKYHACEDHHQELADGRVIAISRRRMSDGGMVSTTDDITERAHHKRQLDEYTARLESSNKELQNFAYIASHDLQEPLRKIETFASRLIKSRSSELPADAAYQLGRIQDAATRMRRLINDLLGYARLSNDTRQLQKICLNDTINGVLSDLHVRIEETHATIHCEEMPPIDADPTKMRQLFQNLIANALKFSKKDVPPVIRVTAMECRSAQQEPQLRIVVADNGIGLDNAYKDQIFQIFQRLNSRSEYEGTGIGLATCRKIVEQHRGTIEADGRPGEGTRFTIQLPMARRDSPQSGVVAPAPVAIFTLPAPRGGGAPLSSKL